MNDGMKRLTGGYKIGENVVRGVKLDGKPRQETGEKNCCPHLMISKGRVHHKAETQNKLFSTFQVFISQSRRELIIPRCYRL